MIIIITNFVMACFISNASEALRIDEMQSMYVCVRVHVQLHTELPHKYYRHSVIEVMS
jgi:hypothetical protein